MYRAPVEPGGARIGSNHVVQFRIPHSALRIRLILIPHSAFRIGLASRDRRQQGHLVAVLYRGIELHVL